MVPIENKVRNENSESQNTFREPYFSCENKLLLTNEPSGMSKPSNQKPVHVQKVLLSKHSIFWNASVYF